jgi:Domain of unknown function (DUF4383)/Short repeat of unknown function (DUF308)
MSNTNPRTRSTTTARARVQQAALAVGAVFLLVGVLGFVPGITTKYSDTADDWLHLVLGLGMIALGLVLSRDRGRATTTA